MTLFRKVSPEKLKSTVFWLSTVVGCYGFFYTFTPYVGWQHFVMQLPLLLGGGVWFTYYGVRRWKWYDVAIGLSLLFIGLLMGLGLLRYLEV